MYEADFWKPSSCKLVSKMTRFKMNRPRTSSYCGYLLNYKEKQQKKVDVMDVRDNAEFRFLAQQKIYLSVK